MADPATRRRPNVLVFFTDQQRWDTAGCYGSGMNITPNLDAMAAAGARFDLAFTCQPVCAPARASLQTGRYAAATGVYRNGIALPADERTLAHWFRDAGYRVGYIGKWHLGGPGAEPVPPQQRGGYVDRWLASNVLEFTSHPNEGHLFDEAGRAVEFTGYRSDFLTARAADFVRESADDPFFLLVSFIEPHHQNDMKRFVAPDGYAQRYADCWVPPDLRPLPGDWMRELPDYYGQCARLDENLGQILNCLDEAGLAEDTIVVFLSDHGCHFRTRNSEYKRSCHESCLRIPMVFRGPGFDRRHVVPELVSLVDVPPTLLDAAGLAVPTSMHGRSMLPLLDR
ncbi:MAG: sulfatase-like hydrolase/transferase, partial [Planctomycetota bacterium]